jgi:hypothetical protein
MATVNFSVPEDVKNAFNKTFKGQNKSAIIAELMRRAVEEAKVRSQRSRAIRKLLGMRLKIRPMTEEEFRRVRETGRP